MHSMLKSINKAKFYKEQSWGTVTFCIVKQAPANIWEYLIIVINHRSE